MNDDFDVVDTETEQHGGLDHLEALVRERGRIDCDPRPHLPGGVVERLLGRHVLQV